MRQSKRSGRSKKLLAVILTAAMIAGNALTVLAEDVSGNTVEIVEEKEEDISQESGGVASGEESSQENTEEKPEESVSVEETSETEAETSEKTESSEENETSETTETSAESEEENETESETAAASVSGNSVSGNDVAEKTGFELTYAYDKEAVTVEGPDRVEEEEDFSFRVTVNKGYTLLKVTCGGETLTAEETDSAEKNSFSYVCEKVTEDTEVVIKAEKEAEEELIFEKKDVVIGNGRATVTVKAMAEDENLKDAELVVDGETVDSRLLKEYAQNEGMEYLSHVDFGLHFEKKAEDGLMEEVQPSKPVKVTITFTKELGFDSDVQKAELLHVTTEDGKQEKVEKAADLYEMAAVAYYSLRNTQIPGMKKVITFETDSFSPFPIMLMHAVEEEEYTPLTWANTGSYNYVPGNSKWKAAPIDSSQPTTGGIQVDVSHVTEDGSIVYTIPAGFSSQTININATEDVKSLLNGSYVPGDKASFTIKIVNNSGYTFNYVKNSFYGGTESNAYMYEDTDPKYQCVINMSSSTGLSATGGWVDGATGFDGSPILNYSSNPAGNGWGISRTSNAALRYLLQNYCDKEDKKDSQGKDFAFTSNGGKNQRFYTDEYLGKALKRAGYTGIEQLSNYYIDYYNNIKGTNVTKLEDLDPSYLYNSLFSGNRMYVRETNPEVVELGYNFFYNNGTRIVPEDTKGMPKSQFTIGNWMRNETGFEGEIESLLGEVTPGNRYELPGFKMELDYLYISNAYMNMDFGFTFGLQLTRNNPPTPPVPPAPDEPAPGTPTPADTPTPTVTTAVLGESAAPDVAVLGEALPPQIGVLGESKGPGTGDSAPVAAWGLAALGTAAFLAAYATKKRRKTKSV